MVCVLRKPGAFAKYFLNWMPRKSGSFDAEVEHFPGALAEQRAAVMPPTGVSGNWKSADTPVFKTRNNRLGFGRSLESVIISTWVALTSQPDFRTQGD